MVDHLSSVGISREERSVSDKCADHVGVDVGGRASVLDVALTVGLRSRGGNAEGGSAIGDTVGELLAAGRLVDAGQTLLVVVTVDSDMGGVLNAELSHHVVDVLHALSTVSHGLGGVIAVAARSVPVVEELGCKRNIDVVVLSNSLDQVAGDPQVVTDIDTLAWADLVFELTGHHFDVGARDGHSSIQASLVVGVSDCAAEAHVGSNRAVVGTLGTRVTIVGPAKGLLGELGRLGDECVLLLDTVPGLLVLDGLVLPDLLGKVSEVSVGRDKLGTLVVLPSPALTHDDDVVTSTEGVSKHSDGLEDHLRLLGDGLVA